MIVAVVDKGGEVMAKTKTVQPKVQNGFVHHLWKTDKALSNIREHQNQWEHTSTTSAKWTCAPSLKTLNTSDKETIAQNWLAHHYSDYATFLCLYLEIIDDNLVGRLTNPAPSKSFRKHKHYTKSNKIIHKHKESQRINRSIKIKWKSQRKTMIQSIRGTQVHFQEMFFCYLWLIWWFSLKPEPLNKLWIYLSTKAIIKEVKYASFVGFWKDFGNNIYKRDG